MDERLDVIHGLFALSLWRVEVGSETAYSMFSNLFVFV